MVSAGVLRLARPAILAVRRRLRGHNYVAQDCSGREPINVGPPNNWHDCLRLCSDPNTTGGTSKSFPDGILASHAFSPMNALTPYQAYSERVWILKHTREPTVKVRSGEPSVTSVTVGDGGCVLR